MDQFSSWINWVRLAHAVPPTTMVSWWYSTAFGSAMTLGRRQAIVVDLNTTGDLAVGPPTTMCHEGTGLRGSVDSHTHTRTDMRT